MAYQSVRMMESSPKMMDHRNGLEAEVNPLQHTKVDITTSVVQISVR
jgi:hypothetical protein